MTLSKIVLRQLPENNLKTPSDDQMTSKTDDDYVSNMALHFLRLRVRDGNEVSKMNLLFDSFTHQKFRGSNLDMFTLHLPYDRIRVKFKMTCEERDTRTKELASESFSEEK